MVQEHQEKRTEPQSVQLWEINCPLASPIVAWIVGQRAKPLDLRGPGLHTVSGTTDEHAALCVQNNVIAPPVFAEDRPRLDA